MEMFFILLISTNDLLKCIKFNFFRKSNSKKISEYTDKAIQQLG